MLFTSFWCPKWISTNENIHTGVGDTFFGIFHTSNNTTISRQEHAYNALIELEIDTIHQQYLRVLSSYQSLPGTITK